MKNSVSKKDFDESLKSLIDDDKELAKLFQKIFCKKDVNKCQSKK